MCGLIPFLISQPDKDMSSQSYERKFSLECNKSNSIGCGLIGRERASAEMSDSPLRSNDYRTCLPVYYVFINTYHSVFRYNEKSVDSLLHLSTFNRNFLSQRPLSFKLEIRSSEACVPPDELITR